MTGDFNANQIGMLLTQADQISNCWPGNNWVNGQWWPQWWPNYCWPVVQTYPQICGPGWQCPVCGRVYGPTWLQCFVCNADPKPPKKSK